MDQNNTNTPFPGQPPQTPPQGGYPPNSQSMPQPQQPVQPLQPPPYPQQQGQGIPPTPPQSPYPYASPSSPYPQQPIIRSVPPRPTLTPGAHISTPTPPPRPRRYDRPPLPIVIMDWIKSNWWSPLVGLLILLIAGNIVYQVAYPSQALPPGVVIDGLAAGKTSKGDLINKLNDAYGNIKVEIFFGNATVPHKTPLAKEIGIQVDNAERLKNASYPLWLRLVPTSIWWASNLVSIGEPLYNYDKVAIDQYTLKELGADCKIPPKNANLKLEDDRFAVIKSVPGGTCNIVEFTSAVQKAKLGKSSKYTIRTPIQEVDAPVTNKIAQELADRLNRILNREFAVQAGTVYSGKISSRVVKGWLTFKAVVPEDLLKEKAKLVPVVEPDRVGRYLKANVASKVEKKPGVTKIATRDFTVTSHVNGSTGTEINVEATIPSIGAILEDKSSTVIVALKEVAPSVQYSRSYTPTETGFRALLAQFADDNPGTIGISFREESGKKPLIIAAANDQVELPAHGFEGLYVAYAAQIGIENGSLQPTDRIAASRSIEDCVEAAVESQDSECIEALLTKVGNPVVHDRLRQLGLTKTSFTGDSNKTTAHDMGQFMHKLLSREANLRRNEVLDSPMRNNKLREGLIRGAAGTAYSAAGASEKGYAESVVVSYKGKYALSYIAENKDPKVAQKLIAAIEKLRKEKQELKQ